MSAALVRRSASSRRCQSGRLPPRAYRATAHHSDTHPDYSTARSYLVICIPCRLERKRRVICQPAAFRPARSAPRLASLVYVRSTFSSSLRRPLTPVLAYPSTYFSHLYDVYAGGARYLASEKFSLLSLESHLFHNYTCLHGVSFLRYNIFFGVLVSPYRHLCKPASFRNYILVIQASSAGRSQLAVMSGG